MKTPIKFAVATLVVIIGLVAFMARDANSLDGLSSAEPNSSTEARAIEFYCAAGMSKPIDEIIKA